MSVLCPLRCPFPRAITSKLSCQRGKLDGIEEELRVYRVSGFGGMDGASWSCCKSSLGLKWLSLFRVVGIKPFRRMARIGVVYT